MAATDASVLAFFRTPGPMTSLPPEIAAGELPADPDSLRRVVQGLLLHRIWAPAYGVSGPDLREDEANLRSTGEMLRRAQQLCDRPLTEPRAPIDRVVGLCRHFAVLYTALLRHAGVPARARCGFARYFEPGRWIDHWITEWFDGTRWVQDDPQIDDLQATKLGVDFDPYDQPSGTFLPGGQAWLATRSGQYGAEQFGIFDMSGLWFIAGNVVRDLASLNNVEVLPWDYWPTMPAGELDGATIERYDELARLAASDDIEAIWSRYRADEALRVPDTLLPPAAH